MTEQDRAAKKAEELISARCLAAPQYLHGERDAVASELREAYDEIARLRAEVNHWREAAASVGQSDGHGWAEETKALRVANQKLLKALTPEKRHEFNLAELAAKEKA